MIMSKHNRIVLWAGGRCQACGAFGPHYCSRNKKNGLKYKGCPIIHDCGLWDTKLQGCMYFTPADEPFYEDCAAVNLVHSHGLLHIREDSR